MPVLVCFGDDRRRVGTVAELDEVLDAVEAAGEPVLVELVGDGAVVNLGIGRPEAAVVLCRDAIGTPWSARSRRPPVAAAGVELPQDAGAQFDLGIEQTGPATIRLICALPVGGHKTRVNYAYKVNIGIPDHIPDHQYPSGRGCLREDWSTRSKIIDGEDILSWVPSFSISVDPAVEVDREVAAAA